MSRNLRLHWLIAFVRVVFFLRTGIRTGDQVLVSNQVDRGQISVSNRSEDDINGWKFL